MPKMKTNSSAKKRFRVTKKGRIKFKQAHRSHIMTKKSPKRKRQLRKRMMVGAADLHGVKRMLAGS